MDAEPDAEPDWDVTPLVMDCIVRMEPVGERVVDRSGIETARSRTSLSHDGPISMENFGQKKNAYQMALTHLTLSLALSAPSLSTPSLYSS